MTIVIISIAVAGVVGAFSLIAGRSADSLNHTRAVELAQLYMGEILTKNFAQGTPQGGVPKYSGACTIGPDGAEIRSSFNDVDDYDGLDESPASATGTVADYSGFGVSVRVTCSGSEVGLAETEAKRIDVTITEPGGQAFVFAAYRANF